MNITSIKMFCMNGTHIVLPTLMHNIRHMFNFKKQIALVSTDDPNSKIMRMLTVFPSINEIRCPSSIFGSRFVNYSPGMREYNLYLRKYFR